MKLKPRRYMIAFIITLGVFILGLVIGLLFENSRVTYLNQERRIQSEDLTSLQMQYNLIDQLSGEGNCKAVQASYSSSIKNLEAARLRLESYNQESSSLSKEQFDMLKRDYTIAQIQFWLLAKRSESVCNNDIVTILYFYGNSKDCPECENQGFILTYMKNLFEDNLLVFSFDGDFTQEPTIGLLKSIYGVTSYPTLVIGDKVYKYTGKDELFKIICNEFNNNSHCPNTNITGVTINTAHNANSSATIPLVGNKSSNNISGKQNESVNSTALKNITAST